MRMQVSSATLTLLLLFASIVKSQEVPPEVVDENNGSIDTAKLLHEQKARIDFLESALHAVSSALISQNNKLFAPLVSILRKDTHITSLLSTSRDDKAKVRDEIPRSSNSSYMGGLSQMSNETNAAIGKMKQALKCSQPELFDINSLAKLNPTSSRIILMLNQSASSVSVTWKPPKDCYRHLSGFWVRLYQSGDTYAASDAQYLAVPWKCLTKGPNQTLSFLLQTNIERIEEKECRFSTARLKDCHAYTIQVVPNYQSFKGNLLQSEIVVPPELINRTNMEAITSVNVRSGEMLLHWLDNSGCSDKLEQISVRVFEGGKTGTQTGPTLKIPRKCFDEPEGYSLNLFSLTLPRAQEGCVIDWKPLNNCRSYTFEITSHYLSDWTGPPSTWTIFTSRERQSVRFSSHFPEDPWQCPNIDFYYCKNRYGYPRYHSEDEDCYHQNDFCNVRCVPANSMDRFCSNPRECLQHEHKCGIICLPPDLVCDGNFDCIDGSDETSCDFCHEVTGSTGHVTSHIDYSSLGSIHQNRPTFAGFTNVLISVPVNQTIWLAFEKFYTEHQVQIFDGPYSTYPLLGSFPARSSSPLPLRSSSNSLYLRFPTYISEEKGIDAYYVSMTNQGEPFRLGCDGYVNGRGMVNVTAAGIKRAIDDLTISGSIHCLWYIEARNEQQTLLLKTTRDRNIQKSSYFTTLDINAEMFGDWKGSKLLRFSEYWRDPSSQTAVVYTPGNKALLQFPVMNAIEQQNHSLGFSIRVISLSSANCTFELTGSSGTIKSPLYPNVYPHLSDCRWRIVTPVGTSVRLLFALFETEEAVDFVYVYNGLTFDSTALLQKSGALSSPFVVNSSSNEVLVRFVSDDENAMSGFLAVYTAV